MNNANHVIRTFLEDLRGHVLEDVVQKEQEADRKGERTPGVPQISVKRWNFSSSITRLRPKSAIMISASSACVRKSKFSGLRSKGYI